jgi:hypothetical protein
MSRLGQPPGESYFDAVAIYFELANQLESAWLVREEERRFSIGKGQLAYEATIFIKRVRLLHLLNRPLRPKKPRLGRLLPDSAIRRGIWMNWNEPPGEHQEHGRGRD